MRSSIDISNALHQQLMLVPDIVSEFESKSLTAVPHWLDWIKTSENILKRFQFAECSKIAGIHADIIALSHKDLRRMELKKITASKCLESISPAQAVLYDLYEVAHNKIETAESLLRQLVTTMNNSGLFEGQDTLDQSFATNLLNQIRQNPQLSPSVNNIIASLGYSDVLRLLVIEIANM